ncbi:MAG: class I mannose-6-phosphate isomerase [Lachnospiraceae bacterium]|nr:class I mannose-6-phosphate isomerase [Lachnospiraceae bacterium]
MILFFKPVLTHNIWGGTKLRDIWKYDIDGNDIGECWGIAAHAHGDVVVSEGEYAGKHLSELWRDYPELFYAQGYQNSDRFPLLVKIIAADKDLSIQVHPDDEYAKEHENGSLGKTECWYILDCEEDSKLVVGHNAKTKEELDSMIDGKRWSEFIREIPIHKGDFINILPGTVHAIKGGITLIEVQQNSDITYRVYDYDRLSNGKPRDLHIQQSKDVITVPALALEDSLMHDDGCDDVLELLRCKYFNVWRIKVDGEYRGRQDCPFTLMTVFDGEGTIDGHEIHKGSHFLIAADTEEYCIKGNLKIIASGVPVR